MPGTTWAESTVAVMATVAIIAMIFFIETMIISANITKNKGDFYVI
jgi:hypothetical protein